MELKTWYNLDECIDRKLVTTNLKELKDEGKIEFSIDRDILKIEDIDLDEAEIEDLLDLFDENDVFEELEYLDEDDDEWSNDNDDYDEEW